MSLSIRSRFIILGLLILLIVGLFLLNGYRNFERTNQQLERLNTTWNKLRHAQDFSLMLYRDLGNYSSGLATGELSDVSPDRMENRLNKELEEWKQSYSENPESGPDFSGIQTKLDNMIKLMRVSVRLEKQGHSQESLDLYKQINTESQEIKRILHNSLIRRRSHLPGLLKRSFATINNSLWGWIFFDVDQSSSLLLVRDWMQSKKINLLLSQQWLDVLGFIVLENDLYKQSFLNRGFRLKSEFNRWKTLRKRRSEATVDLSRISTGAVDRTYQRILTQALEAIKHRQAENPTNVKQIISRKMEPQIQSLWTKTEQLNVSEEISSTRKALSNAIYYRQVQNFSLSVLIGVVLLFFTQRWGWSMIDSIRRLSDSTRLIGEGKFDERVAIDTGDELETLGQQFNRMATQLEETTVSREYFQNILNTMGEMLFVVDHEGEIVQLNSALLEKLDYEEDELLGEPARRIVADDEHEQNHEELFSPQNLENRELGLQSKPGETVPVLFSQRTLSDERIHGHNSLVCAATDISNLKETQKALSDSLEETKTLLQEVHHRVKNNMQVILGLLGMQGRKLENEEAKKALDDSRRRVYSMSLIHEKLYENEQLSQIDFSEYVEELVDHILGSHEREKDAPEVQIDVEDRELKPESVIPSGLMINELVTNSLEHAFTDGTDGTIEITFFKDGPNYHLRVADNGTGLQDGDLFENPSLGSKLVKNLAENQLHGTIEVTDQEGLQVDIIFPPTPERYEE